MSPITKKQYECNFCEYSAHAKHHLDVHINVRHTKKIIYKCDNCDFKSYNYDSMHGHKKTQHPTSKVI